MRAAIVTYHVDATTARSIETSLAADNRDAPKPLLIRSRASGTKIVSTISGAQDIESLLTTIDDLLLCLIAADKVMSTVKWKGLRRRDRSSLVHRHAPKV